MSRPRSSLVLLVALAAVSAPGCATKGQSGALLGTGIGALAGAAMGDEAGAVIGGAVGAGAGYLIGNEFDKTQAQSHDFSSPTALSGTTWKVISMNPTPEPPFSEKIVEFRGDGIVVTTTKDLEGLASRTEEHYRIVDDVLIVNRQGYIINAKFAVDRDQIIVKTEKFSAVGKRM